MRLVDATPNAMNLILRCLRPALGAPDLRSTLLAAACNTTCYPSQACWTTIAQHQRSMSSDASAITGGVHAAQEPTKPSVKPQLVAKYLGIQLAAQPERLRRKRLGMMKEFQRHQGDCGSPEVTVALWTERIRDLAKNFQSHRKNVAQMKQLHEMFHRRRRMLTYLRKKDFEAYCFVIHKLGLKDIYVEMRAEDRYPVGSVHGQPLDDRVLRQRFAFHPEYRLKKTSLWNRLRPQLMDEDPILKLT